MKVIFSKHFLKLLNNLWSIKKNDILNLLKKYPETKNLISLDSIWNAKVLKWYLFSKKIRIMILFEFIQWRFIPFYIWKKESKKCKNITKNNYIEFYIWDIDKIYFEIDNDIFEEIEFEK